MDREDTHPDKLETLLQSVLNGEQQLSADELRSLGDLALHRGSMLGDGTLSDELREKYSTIYLLSEQALLGLDNRGEL